MQTEVMYTQSIWLVALVLLLLLIASTEAGFRFGSHVRSRRPEQEVPPIQTIQGGLLGLVGLMLGFSFAMAAGRFEARRTLLVSEVNAIGTAYLRARMLPPTDCAQAQSLLRRYVDIRVDVLRPGFDIARIDDSIRASSEVQDLLWAHVVNIANSPGIPSATVMLFATSINDVIDLQTTRVETNRSHVPELILFLLFALAFIAVGTVGYGCGLSHRRYLVITTSFALLLTLVIVVILDLDRPRNGLIVVNPRAMLELQQQMSKTPH